MASRKKTTARERMSKHREATSHLTALNPILPATATYLDTATLLAVHSACREWQHATVPAVKEAVKRAIIRSIPVVPQMDAYAWFPACARLHVYRSAGTSAACEWLLLFELVGGMDEDESLVQSAPYLGQRFTIAYGSPSAVNTEVPDSDGWIMQATGQRTILDRDEQFGRLTKTDRGPLVTGGEHKSDEVKETKEGEDEAQGEARMTDDADSKEADGAGPARTGPVFAGLTFCVSGAFSVSQADMKRMLESNGGRVVSTLKSSVDILVCNQAGSGKYTEAERKMKPVVTEEWVKESIEQRKVSLSHFLLDTCGRPTAPGAVSVFSRPTAVSSASASSSSSAAGSGGARGGKVFAGLTFCVSGSFSISQAAMKQQLQGAGGKLATTVTAAVDYLVCNEEGSSKYQAAEEKGKAVVTEEWVTASIAQGKLSRQPEHFTYNPNEDDEGGEEGGEDEGEEGDEDDDGGADWLYNLEGVHPSRQYAQLRNGSYPLHRDAEWYSERGVTVAQAGFVDGGINAVDVLRALVHEHRDELLSSEAKLRRLMSPACPLVKLLVLDDWYHCNGEAAQCPDEVKTVEECQAGERYDHQGRYNPTCHALAQCIVDASPAHYHDMVATGQLPPPNTHWSKWPEAGFHK